MSKKQLITVHYHANQWQQSYSFVRPARRPVPTARGVARMLAAEHGEKPSDYSIERIQVALLK